jgi:non-heme chloroperoxidase
MNTRRKHSIWKAFTNIKATLVILVPLVGACLRQSKEGRIASPYSVRFVTVEKDVKLEVIDWGGSGKSLVLLAGGGNTAHIFDHFAPKLTNEFHVYGITRRGFGASQFTSIENADRLAKDIVTVLDSMEIDKPVLVGHSIGGAEMNIVARIAPGRISALIYLDAGYPYAFSNENGPTMQDFFNVSGPQQPSPQENDLANFETLQKWDAETYGFHRPVSEFRQTWDSTAQGQPTRPRNFPGFAIFPTLLSNPGSNEVISLPSLVIFAVPHKREAWMTASADSSIRNQAEAFFSRIDDLTKKQADVFEASVPSAQVIRMQGMHYIFLSNETEVLKEMRGFIADKK